MTMTLVGAGRSIALDGLVSGAGGPQVVTGATGFGSPDVDARWFSGAGDGAAWRGSRVQARDIALPLFIEGSREELQAHLSAIAEALAPSESPARLYVSDAVGEAWWADVVRVGSGDFDRRASWVRLTLTLRAGDPFWTREDASQQTVRASGTGRGLLGTGRSLSMLRVSSGQALGAVLVENPGDAPAWPVTILEGPGTALTLASPTGQTLTWEGNLLAGQRRVFDHRAGTLVDPDDTTGDPNRYDELGPAPLFWSLPPGNSTVTVELTGASSASSVTLSWRPRRWLVF